MTPISTPMISIPSTLAGSTQSWPLVVRETNLVGPVTVVRYGITDAMIRSGDPSVTVLPRLVAAPPGYFFANPEYSVFITAEVDAPRFFKQARHCLRRWLERVARVLGNSTQRKLLKACNLTERMIRFTGILLIDGQPVQPGKWPDDPPLSETKQRSRDRYERLRQEKQPYLTIGELLAEARKAAVLDEVAHAGVVSPVPDPCDQDRREDVPGDPLPTTMFCSTLVPIPETIR